MTGPLDPLVRPVSTWPPLRIPLRPELGPGVASCSWVRVVPFPYKELVVMHGTRRECSRLPAVLAGRLLGLPIG